MNANSAFHAEAAVALADSERCALAPSHFMKRSELKQFTGCTIDINADVKPAIAYLHADDPSRAYLTVPPPAPEWCNASRYYLTDEDIERITVYNDQHLVGAIRLITVGDRWTAAK